MTATPSAASEALVAGAVTEHYEAHLDAMRAVNATAADAFAERDWRAAQATVTRRLDVYADAVAGAVAALGGPGPDRDTWVAAKGRFAAAVADRVDREIAETFFNSCTRRMLGTVGVDPDVEFTGVEFSGTPAVPGSLALVRYPGPDPAALIGRIVSGAGIDGRWQNLTRDAVLGGAEIRRALRLHGIAGEVDEAVMADQPFYRGQGAYLVGQLRAGGATLPMAVAVHHTSRGLVIGAVLTEPEEVGVLFSYTRAAFCVATDRPAASGDLPRRPRSLPHPGRAVHGDRVPQARQDRALP